jgi:F-type H+-transporting ATPase subunit delta
MRRGTVAAKRYAKALFEVAQAKGQVAETENHLKLVADVLEGNAELRAFLSAPGVPQEAKTGALRTVFGQTVSAEVLNALCLLVERGRQNEIDAVREAFMALSGEALGRIDATVTSAKPLSDEEKDRLAAAFGKILGKTVRLQANVDPSLLGGLTVRIGDTLYDGSLRSKLARLEKDLLATR